MKKILFSPIFLVLVLFAREDAMQMKLSFDKEELFIILDESPVAREFYELLPLELEFSDYVGKEKIASLKKKLSLSSTEGYDPQIGDFFYFSPWQSLGIYYEKQPPYPGLVYLGRVKEGLEKLRKQKGNFKVLIQKYE